MASDMFGDLEMKKLYHRGQLEGNKYIFAEDSEEDSPLQVYKQEPFLEREIQPGDTLQTLSLQFNCPVSELKRLNNIHRDNEIFARRTIKVPVKLFTMKLAGVHTSSSLSHKTTSDGSDTCIGSKNLTDKLNDLSCKVPIVEVSTMKTKDLITLSSIEYNEDAINLINVNGMVLQDDPAENFDVECSTSPLLPQDSYIVKKDKKSIYSCSGADWGISWLQLLVCSLLVGFAGPILYVIYLTEDTNKRSS